VSSDNEPVRSWQEITEEASRERDPKRMQELAKELELAFEARDAKRRPKAVPLKSAAERVEGNEERQR
jgi:hypothetical protein